MKQGLHFIGVCLSEFVDALGQRVKGQSCDFGAEDVALNGFWFAWFDDPAKVQGIVDEGFAEEVLGHVFDVFGSHAAISWIGLNKMTGTMFIVTTSVLNSPVLSIFVRKSLSLNSLLLLSLRRMISWGSVRSSAEESIPMRRLSSLLRNCSSPFLSPCWRLRTTMLERK